MTTHKTASCSASVSIAGEIRQIYSAASCGPMRANSLQISENSCKKGGE